MQSLARIMAICLFLLALPAVAMAHPHSFIEVQVSIRFDEDGLAGFDQTWRLDPMLTATLLDMVDTDHNQKLDRDEVEELNDVSMGSLKDFHFFTFVLVNGKEFEVTWKKDFDAYMDQGCLVYTFFIPCHVKAAAAEKTVKVAIYDPTFFTFVALVGNGGSAGIDPTADPRFGDPSAQAAPGDYERFINATGFEQSDVEPTFSGSHEKFSVHGSLQPAEDMAYYQGMIVPDAFVVTFSRKS